MATWVTHLMITDRVMEQIPELDKHHFSIGNIAPDCNIENEDWTQFAPPREVTHWMSSSVKNYADAERFYEEQIGKRKAEELTNQEYSFLVGYYAHLVSDAEFQRHTRDPARIFFAWERILHNEKLAEKAMRMSASWDAIKLLINKHERLKDIHTIEAEYLEKHPETGYLTEVIGLCSFPDYLDFLPKGAIVRKIGVMGYLPKKELGEYAFIAISREEYDAFVDSATERVIRGITGRV